MPSERGQTQNDTYCVIHSQKGKIIGPIIISETSRDTDGKREIGYKEKIWNSMEIFSILIVVITQLYVFVKNQSVHQKDKIFKV